MKERQPELAHATHACFSKALLISSESEGHWISRTVSTIQTHVMDGNNMAFWLREMEWLHMMRGCQMYM